MAVAVYESRTLELKTAVTEWNNDTLEKSSLVLAKYRIRLSGPGIVITARRVMGGK
jgi:hypothetical protein